MSGVGAPSAKRSTSRCRWATRRSRASGACGRPAGSSTGCAHGSPTWPPKRPSPAGWRDARPAPGTTCCGKPSRSTRWRLAAVMCRWTTWSNGWASGGARYAGARGATRPSFGHALEIDRAAARISSTEVPPRADRSSGTWTLGFAGRRSNGCSIHRAILPATHWIHVSPDRDAGSCWTRRVRWWDVLPGASSRRLGCGAAPPRCWPPWAGAARRRSPGTATASDAVPGRWSCGSSCSSRSRQTSFNEAGTKKPRIFTDLRNDTKATTQHFNEAGAEKPRNWFSSQRGHIVAEVTSMKPEQRSPGIAAPARKESPPANRFNGAGAKKPRNSWAA